MICKKCGKDTAEIDYSVVLTSYPSKYGIHCKNCGNVDYIYCKDAPPQYYEKHLDNAQITKMPNNPNATIAITPLTTETAVTSDIVTSKQLDGVASDIEKQIKSSERKQNKKIKDNSKKIDDAIDATEYGMKSIKDHLAKIEKKQQAIIDSVKYRYDLEMLKKLCKEVLHCEYDPSKLETRNNMYEKLRIYIIKTRIKQLKEMLTPKRPLFDVVFTIPDLSYLINQLDGCDIATHNAAMIAELDANIDRYNLAHPFGDILYEIH